MTCFNQTPDHDFAPEFTAEDALHAHAAYLYENDPEVLEAQMEHFHGRMSDASYLERLAYLKQRALSRAADEANEWRSA